MKTLKILLMSLITLLLISSIVSAGDYDWMRNFNIKAESDPSGLRARLKARFQLDDIKIKAVLDSVDKPANAYMLLRLREMSNQPIDDIIEEYKAEKDKGWGRLVKSLGIKPGSKEFYALKQGQDIYYDREKGKYKVKCKGKSKYKGKGRK